MNDAQTKGDIDDLLLANRANWDERTAIHLGAYPVEAFKAGQSTLHHIEAAEVGAVAGKSLLHLQCHFGLDTLSWARLGARVTGVDFSEAAIEAAHSLASELGIEARFLRSDVYALPDVLDERFDIVFTSYGALTWLPDIRRWAQVAAQFVRPSGFLYVIDGHPLMHLIDDRGERLRPNAGYFDREAERVEQHGSYVGEPTHFEHPVNYQWQHTLADITSAVIDSSLRLEFLHEWPVAEYQAFEPMELGNDGYWRMPGNRWPLLFSLRARRPAG